MNSHHIPRPRLPSNVRLSTTSLPARALKVPGVEYLEASTDEEHDSNTNSSAGRNVSKSSGGGSRRSLPTTPPHNVSGGPNKFRFRNTGSCNGIRRLRQV